MPAQQAIDAAVGTDDADAAAITPVRREQKSAAVREDTLGAIEPGADTVDSVE